MSLSVDRIPGSLSVDPDAAGEEHRHKRGRESRKRGGDSVSISEEARRLLTEGGQGEAEGVEPG